MGKPKKKKKRNETKKAPKTNWAYMVNAAPSFRFRDASENVYRPPGTFEVYNNHVNSKAVG